MTFYENYIKIKIFIIINYIMNKAKMKLDINHYYFFINNFNEKKKSQSHQSQKLMSPLMHFLPTL